MKIAFSPKQKKVIKEADARWNILSGAVRSGKSYASYWLLPKRLLELPGNILLVGKTERTLKRNVIDPMQSLFGEANVSQVYGDGLVDLFGRRCYVVGANDERAVTKIQGLGLSYCLGDEMATWPHNFFEMLKSRLDQPGARFDGTCNPEGPHHWLKEFVDSGSPYIKHFQFSIDDNPFLDPVFVEALKSEYSGVWYKRYILGQWVMAEGSVFDMFDESRHVIDCPWDHEEYGVAVDYATASVMTFGLYGVSEGKVYLLKEYYWNAEKKGRQKTDGQFADDFEDFIGDIKPKEIWIDPSASSFKLELRRRGYSQARPAKNDVINGIRLVSSYLAREKFFIDRSCKDTIQEFGGYVWDPKAQQKGIDQPLKQNDHAMDRNRYFIYSKFSRPQLKPARGVF